MPIDIALSSARPPCAFPAQDVLALVVGNDAAVALSASKRYRRRCLKPLILLLAGVWVGKWVGARHPLHAPLDECFSSPPLSLSLPLFMLLSPLIPLYAPLCPPSPSLSPSPPT